MLLRTKRGYNLMNTVSAMQKAIRRADPKIAGFFAHEINSSGYYKYVWKRLLTVSAEDCWGIITQEIKSLHDAFMLVNEGKKEKNKGRIFISKAIIILCQAKKSRDPDHLQNFIYDKETDINIIELEKYIEESKDKKEELPEYTFDCHTFKGKAKGKTKAEFFQSEFEALSPREPGFFDNVIKGK